MGDQRILHMLQYNLRIWIGLNSTLQNQLCKVRDVSHKLIFITYLIRCETLNKVDIEMQVIYV